MTLRFRALAAVLLAGACVHPTDNPGPIIPAGYDIFRVEPSIVGFTSIDTSTGRNVRLNWLANYGLAGTNCIALSPRSGTDSTGSFVFTFSGSNVGRVERTTNNTTIDTTTGFLLSGLEGTQGTYALTSAGNLHLFWTDGNNAGRFFDPAAVIRLSHDTILSDVAETFRADSITTQWHIRWIFDLAC